MLEIFQYGFIVRGLEAGIMVALAAPVIGMFLVLRRYSLIADTLSHVSFAGVTIGLLLGLNPILTALAVTLFSSLGIERLRETKRVYGESALALFLSGSLALSVVLISVGKGFTTGLFKYLFGSILTVTESDVITITVLALVVIAAVIALYKELVYISFDEEAAKVSGVPVSAINTVLIILAAMTISLAIPVVGVLLIAALIVIPVVAALQLKVSFAKTILSAEIISVVSVVSGIILSFYLDIAAGGTIVLIMLGIFMALLGKNKVRRAEKNHTK